MVSLAKSLDITLHVPDVAYVELEANYLSSRETEYHELVSRISQVRSRLNELGGNAVQIAMVPDFRVEMEARYRARVELLRQSFLPTPTPALELRELLKMAATHQVAFEKDDKGFRDTVIFLSAIEEVKLAAKPVKAVFVSEDHVFRDRRAQLEATAQSAGAPVLLCETVDEIERALVRRQDAEAQAKILADDEALMVALEAHLPDVQNWLDQNVESWDWQIYPYKIYRAIALRLISVTPQYVATRSECIKVSFELEATVAGSYLVTTDPYIPTAPSVPVPQAGLRARASKRRVRFGNYPQIAPTTLTPIMGRFSALVEIEAEATLKDGQYAHFKFVTARIKPERMPTMPPLPNVPEP